MEKTGYSEWGVHATVDCGGCNISAISDKNTIAAFTEYLVKKIDMVAYGNPIIEHFATHDPSKAGYTLLQMIETSAIAAHFVEATGEAYFDIFSCKDFDEDTVVACIQGFFSPTRVQYSMLSRGVNYDLPEGVEYTGDHTVDLDGAYRTPESRAISQEDALTAVSLYDKIKKLSDSYKNIGYGEDHVGCQLIFVNENFDSLYDFTLNTELGRGFIREAYSAAKIDIMLQISEANNKLAELGFAPAPMDVDDVLDALK